MNHEYNRRPIYVPPEVIMLGLNLRPLCAMIALLRFANQSMKTWASHESLLMYLPGWDIRVLKRALCELRDHPLSLLTIKHQADRKTGKTLSNAYSIHLPSLKKIRGHLEQERSVREGGQISPPPRGQIDPPPPAVYRTVLDSKPVLEEGERPHHARSSSFASGKENLETLLRHWQEAYRRRTGAKSPVYARLKWVLRDLLDSQGAAGARAAVDLWFDKGKWAEKAQAHGYAVEELERRINFIVQSPRFKDFKARHEADGGVSRN